MKKYKSVLIPRILFGALSLSFLLSFGFVQAASAVGTGALTLNSVSKTYGQGSEFEINITENSQSIPINSVEADLSYDQTKLQFLGVNTSKTAFPVQIPVYTHTNTVEIGAGALGSGLTGEQVVVSVSFKVLANTGTTAISFASTSALVEKDNNSNIWDGSADSTSFTLNSQAATNTALITSPPSVLVSVEIVNSQNVPVAGAHVTLDNQQSAVTDANGIAGFASVSPGIHNITATYKGETVSQATSIEPSTSQNIRRVQLQVNTKSDASTVRLIIFIILIVLAVVFITIWLAKITSASPPVEPTNQQPTNDTKKAH